MAFTPYKLIFISFEERFFFMATYALWIRKNNGNVILFALYLNYFTIKLILHHNCHSYFLIVLCLCSHCCQLQRGTKGTGETEHLVGSPATCMWQQWMWIGCIIWLAPKSSRAMGQWDCIIEEDRNTTGLDCSKS